MKRFSPDKLIGDELGKPLAALIGTLETFKPSALLAPVQQALGGLKQDLARRANPAQAFAPIERAFDGVVSRLDALNPAALVKPLSAKLHETIDAAVTALPADEIIALLDDILATVQNVSDMAKGARTALTSAQARFAGLADGEAQIRAWYAPVLAKVAAMSDVASLQPALDAVASAVGRLKAAAISATLDGALRPLQSALESLAPGIGWPDLPARTAPSGPTSYRRFRHPPRKRRCRRCSRAGARSRRRSREPFDRASNAGARHSCATATRLRWCWSTGTLVSTARTAPSRVSRTRPSPRRNCGR